MLRVMNASLRRATFVLQSETVEALSYVSVRTGTSMSAIVREVLGQPIVMLAGALKGVPPDPDASQLDLFRAQMVGHCNDALLDARPVLGSGLGAV
jgi:hypothetical protein